MFCPDCGKPNKDDSRFCEECGAALVESEVLEQPLYNEFEENAAADRYEVELPHIDFTKVIEFLKKAKFVLIPVLAVVVLFTAFYTIGSAVSAPEKVVEKYFTALSEGDYKQMYQQLALPNDDAINEETFVAFMNKYMEEQGKSFSDVKNFIVQDLDAKQTASDYEDEGDKELKAARRNFRVNVVDKLTGDIDYLDLVLIRQDAKSWLFFDTYKVSSADYIVQDIRINIPLKAKVLLDGVELTQETLVSEDEGWYTYEIETMFRGMHKISIVSDLFEEYEVERDFYSSDMECSFDEYSLTVLKKDHAVAAYNQAVSDFKTMYEKALAQKPFSETGIKAASDPESLESCYESILKLLARKSDDTGINSISFATVEMEEDISRQSFINEDGYVQFNFSVRFNYEYTYTGYEGWFEPVLTEGERSGSRTVRFAYAYVDGTWKPVYLENYTISLSY